MERTPGLRERAGSPGPVLGETFPRFLSGLQTAMRDRPARVQQLCERQGSPMIGLHQKTIEHRACHGMPPHRTGRQMGRIASMGTSKRSANILSPSVRVHPKVSLHKRTNGGANTLTTQRKVWTDSGHTGESGATVPSTDCFWRF